MRLLIATALMLVSAPQVAFAHGGGLNAQGCHTNRNTGDYHCHPGRGSARAAAPRGRSYGALDAGTYFANCSAARAAGAAPVRSGDPGYASHLDRDGDGMGCE